MKYIVTGCAGFIGSNLVDSLLLDGHQVIGIDNFSTGIRENIQNAMLNNKFSLKELDLLSDQLDHSIFAGADGVFHLSANADVRYGWDHPERDLEQNLVVTHRLLEISRALEIKMFVFSSTGSIYGDASIIPTPEDQFFPIQTSLYGASKLASEAMIQAYSEGCGITSYIFRFVSILGPRYSHGHIVDFYRQLLNSSELRVLGNGYQTKSYLHVNDCIEGIKLAISAPSSNGVNIFNLGTEEVCTVRDSIAIILRKMGLSPKVIYGSEERGWVGDSPKILLSIERMKAIGWVPKHSIAKSIESTVDYLVNNGIK
jgi:UDP-glucose 4-epimerase